MKKIVVLLTCMLPMLVNAQNKNEGVVFQNFDSWQELLMKAKAENKNIFIDAFTTWCGPCKKMDTEVYPTLKIGELLNKNFITVKVQFDRTKQDDNNIKNWYQVAQQLTNKYNIEAFPTFLFLSKNEELLYRETGYQEIESFAALIKKANDPLLNYANQIRQYRSGNMKGNRLMMLALRASQYKDSLAIEIAEKFKEQTLDKNDPNQYLNKDVRDFIVKFQKLFSLNDKLVKFLVLNPNKADKMLDQKGFSRKFEEFLISTKLIYPVIKPSGKYLEQEPEWSALNEKISSIYGNEISNKLLIWAKVNWFTYKKDWQNVAKYSIENIELNGVDTSFWAADGLNAVMYDVIFKHCNDINYLNKSVSYMELILKGHADQHAWIDTYANLLYKTGRKEEALKQEKLALNIARSKNDEVSVKEFTQVLDKIYNNEPTWIVPSNVDE